jgi:hypothetical protein
MLDLSSVIYVQDAVPEGFNVTRRLPVEINYSRSLRFHATTKSEDVTHQFVVYTLDVSAAKYHKGKHTVSITN